MVQSACKMLRPRGRVVGANMRFPFCPALRRDAIRNRRRRQGCVNQLWSARVDARRLASAGFASSEARVLSGYGTGRRKNITATATAVGKARLVVVTVYRTSKVAGHWKAE